MVKNMLVKVVGDYIEKEWTNERTGEKSTIKSIQLVVKDGRESFVAEAKSDVAERVRDMNLKPDTPVTVNLYFDAADVTKDGNTRYFQRVGISDIVANAF